MTDGDELDRVTEALNEALREAEDAIHALRLNVAAETDMGEGRKLRYGKVGGSWILSVSTPDGSYVPLLNAARSLRVGAVGFLAPLVEALRVEHVRMIGEIGDARTRCLDFVSRTRGQDEPT